MEDSRNGMDNFPLLISLSAENEPAPLISSDAAMPMMSKWHSYTLSLLVAKPVDKKPIGKMCG